MVLKRLGTRVGIEDKRGTLIMPELGHEDLAEMIGSSRPMVSKLISDMTREGLLTRGENRHFILCMQPRPSTTTPADAFQPSIRANGVSKQTARSRVLLTVPPRANSQAPFHRP
jgi:hypothetical protein